MLRVKTAVGLENIPEVRTLREEIFVIEQGFEEEFDSIDKDALHMVVLDGELPVATARTFKDENGDWYIGRIAVKKDMRGKGLGLFVMDEIEKIVRGKGGKKASLWAQTRAMSFYEKAGYKSTGETNMEEFCHHTKMEKML